MTFDLGIMPVQPFHYKTDEVSDLSAFLSDPSLLLEEDTLAGTRFSKPAQPSSFSRAFAPHEHDLFGRFDMADDGLLDSPLGLDSASLGGYSSESSLDRAERCGTSPLFDGYTLSPAELDLCSPLLPPLGLLGGGEAGSLFSSNATAGVSHAPCVDPATVSPLMTRLSSFSGADEDAPSPPKQEEACSEVAGVKVAPTQSSPAESPLEDTTDGDFAPSAKRSKTRTGARATVKKAAEAAATTSVGKKASVNDVERPFAKDRYTGTRNTTKPMLDLDAPVAPRSWLVPAVTSRKRLPPAVTSKLLPAVSKKRQRARAAAAEEHTKNAAGEEDEREDPEGVPDELLSAIELKRRQNTIAARRSRLRKAAHQQDLEGEIERLKEDVERWKARALAAEARA